MNYYQQAYNGNDSRQLNFPGFLNDGLFPGGGQSGFPGGGQPGFPGEGPGGFPGFPGGGQLPGGGLPGPGGGFPGGGFPDVGIPNGGQSANAPTTPPPAFTPEQPQFQTFAIDPGAIRRCLYRFTYVWLRRDAFWFFPVFIGRNSIAGFRWSGFRWVYFGIDLDRIESFQCY